jgi:hypothetical protein
VEKSPQKAMELETRLDAWLKEVNAYIPERKNK